MVGGTVYLFKLKKIVMLQLDLKKEINVLKVFGLRLLHIVTKYKIQPTMQFITDHLLSLGLLKQSQEQL